MTKRAISKPKLGQNFLADPQAAKKIVEALGEIEDRIVVEIGPGPGALTRMLAHRAGRLIAIELDRRLAAQLRMDYARFPNVEIIEGDVLQMQFETIVQGELRGVTEWQHNEPTKAKLVGNLPYYITSDILLKLLEAHRNFETMVIMVQREVADRIAAKPGSRDYGLLSATVQLFTEPKKLFTLPPGAFRPAPKVHSTVLRLDVVPKSEKLGVDADKLLEFLKLAFAQKRKTLLNNLKQRYAQADVRKALQSAGMPSDVRAEAAGLEKLARIFQEVHATV